MERGKFVSIEGPDGSGKSSVIKELAHLLWNQADRIVFTREPGGSPIAEVIRELVLDPKHTAMDPRTEALLIAASRRQHLVETIIPAVQQGKLVISDRFVYSSLAYQGIGRKIGVEEVWKINQFAIEDWMPDLTLLIDVPAEVGLERIMTHRTHEPVDRLEEAGLAFHREVRQTYLDIAKNNDKMIVIDGCQPIEEVSKTCYEILKEKGFI